MSANRGRGREASRPRWLTLGDEPRVVRVTVPDRPMREKGFDIDARTLRPARAGDRIEVECPDCEGRRYLRDDEAGRDLPCVPCGGSDGTSGSGSVTLTLTEDPVAVGDHDDDYIFQARWLLVGVTDE